MQIKNSFDKITQNKILKGALIALGGSAALGLLNYLGSVHIDNPNLAMLISWLAPTLINAVKEWMAGVPIDISHPSQLGGQNG